MVGASLYFYLSMEPKKTQEAASISPRQTEMTSLKVSENSWPVRVLHQLTRPRVAQGDWSHRVGDMSVAFLDCSYLRGALNLDHESKCCKDCHEKKQLIYVRPMNPDGNPDWFLCIEAIVCCNLYHFTKNISRDWWESKAIELGVKREDQRGYIYPRTETPQSKAKVKARAPKEPEERSFADFLRRG